MNAPDSPSQPEPRDPKYKDAIFTVPNVICFVRLLGSAVLLGVAWAGWGAWFVGIFIALSLSDWIDGKLARWLHQRSDFGARLDSAADAALYAALLAGAIFLSWDRLQPEWIWIAVGLGSYAVTTGAGLIKFGKVPSYHTYGAKFTQWLALLAGVFFILDWATWPLHVAIVCLVVTNLEATLITLVLDKWQADVLTVFHVWPRYKQASSSSDDLAEMPSEPANSVSEDTPDE